jgi:hypothetical protein
MIRCRRINDLKFEKVDWVFCGNCVCNIGEDGIRFLISICEKDASESCITDCSCYGFADNRKWRLGYFL